MITSPNDRTPGQKDEAFDHAQFERESFEHWQEDRRNEESHLAAFVRNVDVTTGILSLVSQLLYQRIDALVPADFSWRLELQEHETAVHFWPRVSPGVAQRRRDQDMSIALSLLEEVPWDEIREEARHLAEGTPTVRQETVALRSCA